VFGREINLTALAVQARLAQRLDHRDMIVTMMYEFITGRNDSAIDDSIGFLKSSDIRQEAAMRMVAGLGPPGRAQNAAGQVACD